MSHGPALWPSRCAGPGNALGLMHEWLLSSCNAQQCRPGYIAQLKAWLVCGGWEAGLYGFDLLI